jgi:circadian clock protein KaiC
LQIAKLRGAAPLPGQHTFIISSEGMRVFPRELVPPETPRLSLGTRASTGVVGLDAMLDGGIPHGECALVSGPTGSGKSLLVRHFMARGAQSNERGLLVSFEAEPGEYLEPTHRACGPRLHEYFERGALTFLHLSALDLSVDEIVWRICEAVRRTRASRLALDSLAGFALSLAPSFRTDLRQSLRRLVKGLVGLGVTTLATDDAATRRAGPIRSKSVTELLMDVVISQRYVDIDGNVEKTMAVLKMKSSSHETLSRRYTIDESGMVVREPLTRIVASGSRRRVAKATALRARGRKP